MYAHLEEGIVTRSDCPIQYLSWMGKVPDSLLQTDGRKLYEDKYYEEGWLATGNTGGVVGVTFTTTHGNKNIDQPTRTNFNLRGHRSEVVLVKWNEPYQKLATCDATGVIFVWIKHEGRWSIELINDRSSQVTDFTWSHDGRMALICYRDGFVLVGSVAGQRYWSSMLNLDSGLITCGAWNHDDQKVLFGTSDGQLIVMNSTGVMLTQIPVQETAEILSMTWACQKFYLSTLDADGESATVSQLDMKSPMLAISFRMGAIYLVSSYDDVCPKVIHTGLTGLKTEWSNDGEVLAVAGFMRLPNLECRNEIRFYNRQGALRYRLLLPQQGKPVSHITWGHNDQMLFVALGCHIHTIWVTKKVASLQFLCRRCVQQCIKDEATIQKLPLPAKILNSIQAMFLPTIRGYIPEPLRLREFVCIPPMSGERLHCTMIRHGEECSGGHYTLYLEYLGGLIPLLKGKRASKIRPEFVIFDPKIKSANNKPEDDFVFVSSDSSEIDSDSDDDLTVEGCGSPRVQRRKKQRRLRDHCERRDSTASAASRSIDELMYDDNLPECQKLVEVTSNIWGTKFKLHSLASFLPEELGQVLYKTSLLHLQPRQMAITLVEINPELKPVEREPGYNPNHFSESEDEVIQNGCVPAETQSCSVGFHDNCIAISPETPACPALSTPQSDAPSKPQPSKHNQREIFFQPPTLSVKMDQLTPLEICLLDGSPPQRRSLSFKPRSLSPSDLHCPGNLMISRTMEAAHSFQPDIIKSRETSPSQMLNHKNLVDSIQRNMSQELPEFVTVNVTTSQPVNLTSSQPVNVTSSQPVNVTSSQSVNVTSSRSGNVTSPKPPFSVVPTIVTKPKMRDLRLKETGSENVTRSPCESVSEQRLWANKACHGLRYIDDDTEDTDDTRDECKDTVYGKMAELGAREIMTDMLHHVQEPQQACSITTGCGDLGSVESTSLLAQVQTLPCFEAQKKRIILSKPSESRSKLKDLTLSSQRSNTRCLDVSRGDKCTPQNASIESSRSHSASPTLSRRPLQANSIAQQIQNDIRRGSLDLCCSSTSNKTNIPSSASLPTSPVHKILGHNRKKVKSKGSHCNDRSRRSHRRQKYGRSVDSSDDEVALSCDDITTCENYRNLETFQKAQLNKKLRRARSKSDAEMIHHSPNHSPNHSPKGSPILTRKSNFIMHNKAPMWNENSQVYQLDFGGRVTQESAKNFQIEFRGKQVMQFGRIDSNAYTLDFQYPFSAIQAFAVALANVTQRLK